MFECPACQSNDFTHSRDKKRIYNINCTFGLQVYLFFSDSEYKSLQEITMYKGKLKIQTLLEGLIYSKGISKIYKDYSYNDVNNLIEISYEPNIYKLYDVLTMIDFYA